MAKDSNGETVEAFRKSFFYGSRSDLSFKFLADLDDEACTAFLQELFRDVVAAIDRDDISILKHRMIQGQVLGYQAHLKQGFSYDDDPFAPLERPVSKSRLALLTSSGHFKAGHDPKPLGVQDMTQEEAEARVLDFLKEEPILSEIPFDIEADNLRVRHGGYDVRGAKADPNVCFPFEIMRAVQARGDIGGLTPNAYSFVGACSQKRLIKKTLPGWIERVRAAGADAVVMVPV